MQRVIVSTRALILGFAIASATALAQNIQGPAAPNFGLTSSPQTSGISNNAPNANTAARAPALPPPVFNQSNPYTMPQSPERPVSPASPGSVFGDH